MANNRMFLKHGPSGKKVFIAKRNAYGWYIPTDDIGDQLQQFFEELERTEKYQDNFVLEQDVHEEEYWKGTAGE